MTSFVVFNADQADNLVVPEDDEVEPFEPLDRIAEILDGYPNGPVIRHGGSKAGYSAQPDLVVMPIPEDFDSAQAYYSTLAHELVHSTGHESRLNRDSITGKHVFGSPGYAREELVAEIGACLLLADSNVEPRFAESASYIEGWRRDLSADPRLIFQASSAASRAADWIEGIVVVVEHESEREAVAA
jgi:antirestriction protein ArdC